MELDEIMDGLTQEIAVSLKAMSKTKDLDKKEAHSRIVKNMCQSLGVFFDMAGEMMPFDLDDDMDDDSEDEDIPF
jgi:hypothetical protein